MAFMEGQYLRRSAPAELATIPLVGRALRTALATFTFVLLAALAAAAVRVLPWVFDPEVPLRVALPFARSIGAVALEASIVVGWPLGWTLAAFHAWERNEARVLSSLGERPERTIARLTPQAIFFSAALSAAAFAGGRDAREPGRVLDALVEEGRVACSHVTTPRSYGIPFTEVSWICHPGRAPRVAGKGPGRLGDVFFTADRAQVAYDLRSIVLGDAWLVVGNNRVHARQFAVQGLPSWFHASRMPPWGRAIVLVVATWFSAVLAVGFVLAGRISTRFSAIAVGALGPLATLFAMRALEQMNAHPATWFSVPLAAAAAPVAAVLVLGPLREHAPRFIAILRK